MTEKQTPKYKCVSCDKLMHKPNQKCSACRRRKKLMKKANVRGQDKFSYVERKKEPGK